MRPPMNQSIYAEIPVYDDKGKPVTDDYGRPHTETIDSIARVQFKSQLISNTDGQHRQVNLEIDVPPEVDLPNGTEVTYTTIQGKKSTGTVENSEEITNLAGTKVYYRTVYVNG